MAASNSYWAAREQAAARSQLASPGPLAGRDSVIAAMSPGDVWASVSQAERINVSPSVGGSRSGDAARAATTISIVKSA
jgi:hypothetical protein